MNFEFGRVVASLDRKCLGAGTFGETRAVDRRDIFDKETRRKPLSRRTRVMEIERRFGDRGGDERAIRTRCEEAMPTISGVGWG